MQHSHPAYLDGLDERVSLYGTDGLNEPRATKILESARGLSPVPARATRPGLALVILNLNKPELIVPLLSNLRVHQRQFAARKLVFEVLIGDTGSTDRDVLAAYEKQPAWVRIVRGLKYQFSRSNNQAFAAGVGADQVAFVNNDVIVAQAPNCLMNMYLRMAENPGLGVQGPVMRFNDLRLQHVGVDIFRSGPLRLFCYHPHAREEWNGEPGWFRQVPAVTGAFLHTRAALYARLGGFDEVYEAEGQDADLCYQIRRAGYRVEVVDVGVILHLENATRPKGEEHWEDRRVLMRRWSSFLSSEFE